MKSSVKNQIMAQRAISWTTAWSQARKNLPMRFTRPSWNMALSSCGPTTHRWRHRVQSFVLTAKREILYAHKDLTNKWKLWLFYRTNVDSQICHQVHVKQCIFLYLSNHWLEIIGVQLNTLTFSGISVLEVGPHCRLRVDSFSVRARVCPLTLNLHITNKFSEHRLVSEGDGWGGFRIVSLLFVGFVVLLASSGRDLQLGWDETWHLQYSDRGPQFGDEILPHVLELKYRWFLFMNEGESLWIII